MNAIEAKGLTKIYGKRAAVSNLNLSIEEGEIYGFLGENGAGKSTTIRMLLGLIWPDDGEAWLNGCRVQTGKADALVGIGAMLDNPYIYGHLPVVENLRLFANLSGPVTEEQIARALDLLGLTEMRKQAAGTLSHGQKQRLGIAQALLPDNRLLLLDEPQNGLDPLWVRNLRDILRQLSNEGITVLISSHRLHEIEQVCHRVGIIHRGEMLYEGAVEPLLATGDFITVRCTKPQEALGVLDEAGFTMEPGSNSVIRVRAATETEASRANRILVEAGFDVSELMRKKITLEEIFLRLTGGKGNEDGEGPAD